MNQQKNDNHDYETAPDALLDYFNLLPKATVKLLNISRYQLLMETAAALQKVLAESLQEGSLMIDIDADFNLGSISGELPELSVMNPKELSDILKYADNYEIYPLTNGNLRFDVVFQNILKGCYGEERL